jgi:plastocyanin
MRRGARLGLLLALLAGVLSLGSLAVVGAAEASLPAAAHGKRQAKRSSHESRCARRSRRESRRAPRRRCRAKSREKPAAAHQPQTPVPALVVVPAGELPAPAIDALASPPSAIAIPSIPETKEQPKEEAPEVSEPEPPSIPHIQVNAVEYSFSLSRTSVPAGKVVLEFRNDGQDPHNLNIAPSEGPSEEPVGNTPSQGVDDVSLEMRPGSYTLFCSLPTHEAKGMKATLTVE